MAGGTRLRVYERPEDGLADALRLAAGMTHKWAALEMPVGGGKAVLAVPGPLAPAERQGLLERYALLLDSLGGRFSTGEDLGTGPQDMLVIGRVSSHVHGVDFEKGVALDPGPFTARGVLAAIRATVAARFDADDLAGCHVAIQGLGHVGAPLARLLAASGAELVLTDIDHPHARGLADEVGGEVVDADEIYDVGCDVYAPCAVGETLNRQTIPRLRCAAVAGSANSQLEREADADALHGRDILYAPDYVANAGGAVAFGSLRLGLATEEQLASRVDSIGPRLQEIFSESAAGEESPLHAARRRVDRFLASARERPATPL